MPRQHGEEPETDGDLFDRLLIEATESEFEYFTAEAPQLLRTKSLDVLRDFKARVEARLAAEPIKSFVNMNDPHEIYRSF